MDGGACWSRGGSIAAQGGSSGGAVVNAWGRLVGLITTTTEGKTTGERDLHAITLNYIDRDSAGLTGMGLAQFLAGDLATRQANFNTEIAPDLIRQLLTAQRR